MEQFDYGLRVAEATGKQDKIELALGDWRVRGSEERVTRFLDLLGSEPFARATPAVAGLEGGPLRPDSLFTRHSGSQRYEVEMRVRGGGRGSVRSPGAPLFSGRLSAVRERVNGANGEAIEGRRLKLDLSINPTRYVVHQPLPGRNPYVPPDTWGAPSLATRRTPLRTPHEASLDAKDNVLLGPRTQAFARPDVWPAHLLRYWEGILDQLNAEFLRAAEGADVDLSREPYLNLRSAETYWEFAAEDPIALVREMEPVLTALGIEASVREFATYPDGLAQREFVGNSLSIRVLLSTGVMLRVYAKTTRRIRFEVHHNLRDCASVLGGAHTTTARWGREARGHHALLDWLATLEVDAANRLNGVLEVLERQQGRPASSLRPYNLVHRVIRACPDDRTAENVLSLLVNTGAVRVLPHDPLRPVVELLVQSQVLERLGGTRNPTRYVLTPQFRLAVAELRGARRWPQPPG